MFKESIIIALCLMVFQPCLGMENDRIQEPSTLKGFEHKQLRHTEKEYKVRAEEMDKKSSKLLDQSTDLGAIADSLTIEANRLANVARNSNGSIEIIKEAYISAEQAYKKAAKAHNEARMTELAAAKIELAAAKAEKALYKLMVAPNTEIDNDFSENEHVINTKRHMTLWQASKDNADAATSLIIMLLNDSKKLRLERKKKVQFSQESQHGQNSIALTNPEKPLLQFNVIPNDNQIKSPVTDAVITLPKSG